MTTTPTTAPLGGAVRAGQGRTLLEGPFGAVLLAGPAATGGLSFVLHPLAARTLGSPVHTHRNEDEFSYVLEGEVGVQIGDETLTAGPGDLVLKPRGVPHAFWNPTDRPARLLEVIAPGDFAAYFEQLAGLLRHDGPPDPEALGALAAVHGMDLDPASVPRLAEAHGLRLGRA